MLLFAKMIFVLGLLVVTSLGPGTLLMRRLRWSPLERLCAAVAASLLMLYAFALIMLMCGLTRAWYWGWGGFCATSFLMALPQLKRFYDHKRIRVVVRNFGMLLLWGVLLLALTRHYSGGQWSNDWHFHYTLSRALIDPGRALREVNPDAMSTRPLMMNFTWAYEMALAGPDFELFQFAGTFLNLLLFLPCCLIAGAVVRGGARRTASIATAFLFNLMLWQNATYTWTKLLAGFYTVLGLALYLSALRKGHRDRGRMVGAFVALAGGCLAHYATVPYAAFVFLHYVLNAFWKRGPRRWREALLVGATCGIMLGSWFGWTSAHFGGHEVTTSNATIRYYSQFTFVENVQRSALNVVYTVVPFPLRGTPEFTQPISAGWWRDWFFSLYVQSLLPSMGMVGGVCVVWGLWRRWGRRRRGDRAGSAVRLRGEEWFWILLIPFVVVVGIAVHDFINWYGLTHICLQPLVLIGVTFLAAGFTSFPKRVRIFIVAGYAFDFVCGIALHFWMQHHAFFTRGPYGQVIPNPAGLSDQAIVNWLDKQIVGGVFFGDHFVAVAPWVLGALIGIASTRLTWLYRAGELEASRRARLRASSTSASASATTTPPVVEAGGTK